MLLDFLMLIKIICMSEKTNFYVFERKEIFLITILVILVAITSFLFGLKIGSNYSFEDSGYNGQDRGAISSQAPKVDLTSTLEENVEAVTEIAEKKTIKREDINKKIEESLKEKMLDEFSDADKKLNAQPVVAKEVTETVVKDEAPVVKKEETVALKADSFSGKHTINVGSFPALTEAKDFAEGFKVLGFNPIVTERQVPGKGNMFRVSIGVFDSLAKAKEFVIKNKSVFAERDFFFYEFD